MNLAPTEKASLFYYSVYFYYYSWDPLYFLILFIGFIVLFNKISRPRTNQKYDKIRQKYTSDFYILG